MKNYLICGLISSMTWVNLIANEIKNPFAKKPQAVVIKTIAPKLKKPKSVQSTPKITVDEVVPQNIKVVEPKYKLQGIIGDFVVINNKILTQGEQIGKFIIGEISAKTVVLLGTDINKTIEIDDGI